MLKVLKGANIIDGTGSKPYKANIIIEDSKIIEISNKTSFDQDTTVIDLTDSFIFPGFIDCHQHFSLHAQWLISAQNYPIGYLASQTARAMKAALEVGITTARDLGALEAGYVQAQKDGLIPGPRLQTAVVIIHPTNGLMDNITGLGGAISSQGLYTTLPGIPTNWADGPWEMRKKVREVLRYGAQVIKIANNAFSASMPWLKPGRSLFTEEELNAVVDEAHKAGVPVACHATSSNAILDAVKSGVDTIEHGIELSEECISEMVKRGTWFVPTISEIGFHAEKNPDPKVHAVAKKLLETQKRSFAAALKAGVKIAMGSDYVLYYGGSVKEIPCMVDAGMTPMQAIESATRHAAELMGMENEIGTLETGKEADIVVFRENPLNDISILKDLDKLSLVMQAGEIVAGKMKYSEIGWKKPVLPVKV